MKIGIVGSEGAKFDQQTKSEAILLIAHLLDEADAVVSGACHLGGIDQWAADVGHDLGIEVIEFAPRVLSWTAGYMPRNLQIARESDEVYCITVKSLPAGYNGMTFPLCYHCGTADHVKSGGCWTVKQAKRMGKRAEVICI